MQLLRDSTGNPRDGTILGGDTFYKLVFIIKLKLTSAALLFTSRLIDNKVIMLCDAVNKCFKN
jgi:hypothetical protein